MLLVLILGLVMSGSAAPWLGVWDDYGSRYDEDYEMWFPKIERRVTEDGYGPNYYRRIRDFAKRMENYARHVDHESCIEITDNEYKISLRMPGLNTEDITVKSKKGRVFIKAIHKVIGEPLNDYKYIIDLPEFVDEDGSWSYRCGVLKIVFLIDRYSPTEKTTTPPTVPSDDIKPTEETTTTVTSDDDIRGDLDGSYKRASVTQTMIPIPFDTSTFAVSQVEDATITPNFLYK